MIVVGDFSGGGHIRHQKDKHNQINAIVSIADNNIKGGRFLYLYGVQMIEVSKK